MGLLNLSSTEVYYLYNCTVIFMFLSTAISAFTIPFGYNITMHIHQQRNSLIGELSDSIIIEGKTKQDIKIEKVNNLTFELENFTQKMRHSIYGLFFSWFIMLSVGLFLLSLITFMNLKIENVIKIYIMEMIFIKGEIIAFFSILCLSVVIICMLSELGFVIKYIFLFSEYQPLTKIAELNRFKINLSEKKIDNNYSFIERSKRKNEK